VDRVFSKSEVLHPADYRGADGVVRLSPEPIRGFVDRTMINLDEKNHQDRPSTLPASKVQQRRC
jgi:hypothetical protein